jgi:hypothetical protein
VLKILSEEGEGEEGRGGEREGGGEGGEREEGEGAGGEEDAAAVADDNEGGILDFLSFAEVTSFLRSYLIQALIAQLFRLIRLPVSFQSSFFLAGKDLSVSLSLSHSVVFSIEA